MNPAVDALWRSWPDVPWLWGATLATALVYARGWRALARHDRRRWHGGRLVAFLGGLAAILAALASPIEAFASLLLQVHMLQHLLLLLVAPPLIWLGAPLLPLVRGLPKSLRVQAVGPWLRAPLARDLFARATHPLVAWPVFVGVLWLWHTPRGYALALADPTWHAIEHACFLAAGLLFWYPVVLPYPSRPRWSRWIVLPYLVLADVQNTLLSAWLTFAPEPIYRHYAEVPRVGGWTPLADQQAAGVLMWVPGSLALLVPAFWIGLRMLSGGAAGGTATCDETRPRPAFGVLPVVSLPVVSKGRAGRGRALRRVVGGDLLETPLVGAFLRRPVARPLLQAVVLLLAAVVIVDGLSGPSLAPANLAGVAPWIHWRGLVVLALLVGGNFCCMACPFTLPRRLAARWLPAGRAWPRWLRSKWLAVGLVGLFLWSYEAFALWNSPWLTAWIALAYFAAAFVVDGLFRGAAFCKYVCPIGQFNFVQSLVSPLEVAVREPAVCANCRTHECLRGSAAAAGCGMGLFQPRKHGNFDCTFCLDCVQACPQKNVGLFVTLGGLQRLDAFRSGLGRLSRRADVAALIVLLVFGAFANAAGMIAPVVGWHDAAAARLGAPTPLVVSLFYLVALVAGPLVLVGGAAALARRWGGAHGTLGQIATRYCYALVPLGFGMWLAHHGFHFFTSYGTIVPVAQRMALDLGLAGDEPEWQRACCAAVAPWIVRFELLALDFGLLLSLFVAHRLAADEAAARRPWVAFAPWAAVLLLLFGVGVWIVLEPMQMRGTLTPGG